MSAAAWVARIINTRLIISNERINDERIMRIILDPSYSGERISIGTRDGSRAICSRWEFPACLSTRERESSKDPSPISPQLIGRTSIYRGINESREAFMLGAFPSAEIVTWDALNPSVAFPPSHRHRTRRESAFFRATFPRQRRASLLGDDSEGKRVALERCRVVCPFARINCVW